MAKSPNQDLFGNSTMTFGEHLEELRGSLMRSMVALVIATLFGLLIAKSVVGFIKYPLEKSLHVHYSKLAKQELDELYGTDIDPEMALFIKESRMVFEEVYFETNELQRILGPPAGDVAAAQVDLNLEALLASKLPTPQSSMVKTRIWRQAEARLTVLNPTEGFVIWMKAGLVAGFVLSSPYIFYQIWIFVAAGLYPHEKRYVHIYMPFSLGLFLVGAAGAFVFVFKHVLNFLFSFARMMDIEPDLRISEVISFVLFLPLGFGVAFQLPLVMLFLHRIGIFQVEGYVEKWRIAILVIFVISMLLTPADPYSMMLMAGPLTGLYGLGILLCKWMPKGRNPFDEPYEP